ncbi:ABC transporter substrate-binding protein [Hydrogenophaga taeniospiralis]|uniref:ABC transporter substrate-binding protein n=1 Tax=Hydrogenophaga taeniospiralis TaxID=65656 RepID=UPI001CFB6FD1|nr:ABC transporter substrate-binding protein [Hydrogenophaga taeniospiralis]MCB4365573.1 ABC transporter substrate-binding protein [Hydrogenophaga taeniospiralis]
MSTVSDALKKTLAPTGRLRASINLGNPVLVQRNATTGEPEGVSVSLAQAFAQHLGLPLDLVVFDTAGKSVDAVTREEADFGFFAIDPVRGQGIHFTAPYVLIEGAYLVREGSTFTCNDDVDQEGVLVTVGKGSAYDLFLTRELRQAHIVRAPSSPTVVDVFMEQALDVAAGVRQQLEADLQRFEGLRILPGRFMVIEQAMGLPRGRGDEAARCLFDFLESAKTSGLVARELARFGIQGASVAPAAKA